MRPPFHLSFTVPDLENATTYYLEILGCQLGRKTATWRDIQFFGHQLTLHQENKFKRVIPIDHFGVILEKSEWTRLQDKLLEHEVKFLMDPKITDKGGEAESGKFLVADPANNILEFKYYLDQKRVLG